MALPNLNDIYKKSVQPTQNNFGRQNSNITPTQITKTAGNYTGNVVDSGINPPTNATPAEYAKYLYDSGLQNVFNNYQRDIATLEQQEQNQLQDAYYIREMSRKYLGEYASNMGIGDVSGNLIDVYSQYQQNVGEITQQSDMLSLNLQQQFQQNQQAAFQQALQQMEVQLDENAQTTLFNITTNNTGDMDWKSYLQSQLDGGLIDQGSYQQLYTQIYSSKMSQVEANVQGSFYGFKTDENGKLVPKSASEYLEENRSWLSPQDFQTLSDLVNYEGESDGSGSFNSVNWKDVPETLKLFLPESSRLFTITNGQQTFYYAQMNVIVDEDNDIANTVDSSTLTDDFLENNPGEPLISGQTISQYRGTNYIYLDKGVQGAGWYRLFNTSNFYNSALDTIDTNVIKSWNKDQEFVSNVLTTDYFTYDKSDEVITMTGGAVWEKDDSFDRFSLDGMSTTKSQELTGDKLGLYNAFKAASPTGVPKKYQIVVYKGVFYTIGNSGKVIKFKKRLG